MQGTGIGWMAVLRCRTGFLTAGKVPPSQTSKSATAITEPCFDRFCTRSKSVRRRALWGVAFVSDLLFAVGGDVETRRDQLG
jgi:hypothetical protein